MGNKEISPFSNIRPKDSSALRRQLDQSLEYSKSRFHESLVPPRLLNPEEKEELLQTEYDTLNTRFPKRMEIYRHVLRNQRGAPGLSEQDQQQFSRWLKVLNSLDDYIETHEKSTQEERTLYDRQFTVFEDLKDYLEEGNTEGYIKLPTGTGKTVLFTEFVEATGLKTLIVTPTRLLVDQTQERFRQFAPDIESGKYYSDEKDYSKNVTITTYNSLINLIDQGKIDPTKYDLLILDEVHKSLSQRRMEVVNRFTNAFKIGFTATPKYAQDKEVRDLLTNEIHNMGIREAVETGMLSSLSVFLAQTEVDLSDVRITKAGEFLDRDLDRAINIETRNRAAVELYKQLFSGQKAVAYCVSIQHAMDLAGMFNQRGISAAVVYGNQYRPEQKSILERYRSGEIQIVCNADLLIEGFDEPSVTVCLNLRPTASPVVAEQRAGRVLREDPNNPFKHAYIVDFLDRHKNPDFFPVSFAQIVEGAHVYQKYAPEGGGAGTGGGTPHYPPVELDGLRVITDAEEVMRIVRSTIEGREKPPYETGWLSIYALSTRVRLGKNTVYKLLEPYRKLNPIDFKIARSAQGRVIEYCSPELVQKFIDDLSVIRGYTAAPIEGWVSISSLAEQLGVSGTTVKGWVDRYRETNASDLRFFRHTHGKIIEHISPQLAEVIKKEMTPSQPPEGWVKVGEAVKFFGVVQSHLTDRIKEYEREYPGNFMRIRGSNGRVSGYISPNLFELLHQERLRYIQAPRGWLTIGDVASELKLSVAFTKYLVEKLRDAHKDQIGIFVETKRGGLAEHFAPDLVTFIKEQRSAIPEVESGWITFSDLAKELNVNVSTLRKRSQAYKESDTEHVKLFKTPIPGKADKFKFIWHASPELASLLREKYSYVDEAKSGWIFNNALAVELNTNPRAVSRVVKSYRDSHPEYFTIARNPENGKIFEYYSPELVGIVRQNFSEIAASVSEEGWTTISLVAASLGMRKSTLARKLKYYQENNPEYFRYYRDINSSSNKLVIHISPELNNLLMEERKGINDPEMGWKYNKEIADEIGVVKNTVKKFVKQFRDERPDFFRHARNPKDGRVLEYYSPELIEIIRQHFTNNKNDK